MAPQAGAKRYVIEGSGAAIINIRRPWRLKEALPVCLFRESLQVEAKILRGGAVEKLGENKAVRGMIRDGLKRGMRMAIMSSVAVAWPATN